MSIRVTCSDHALPREVCLFNHLPSPSCSVGVMRRMLCIYPLVIYLVMARSRHRSGGPGEASPVMSTSPTLGNILRDFDQSIFRDFSFSDGPWELRARAPQEPF